MEEDEGDNILLIKEIFFKKIMICQLAYKGNHWDQVPSLLGVDQYGLYFW